MAEPEEIHRAGRGPSTRQRRAAQREARRRVRRRDARAARRCALRRKPFVGSYGGRARGGGRAPRRRRHAARGAPRRPAPPGFTLVETPTAADLEREALARADADVIVMAAAVADYRPAAPLEDKRAKDGARLGGGARADAGRPCRHRREGTARPGARRVRRRPWRAAASRARARSAIAKNADLFVFNDVSRSDIGFDAADNEVVVSPRDGERTIAKAPKPAVAAAILDEVERLLSER